MEATSGKGIYEAVWPRGRRRVAAVGQYAPRLDTLEGKTICELWDWIFRGDEIFPMVEKSLARRYPGAKFVSYKEFGSIHGGNEREVIAALPQKLKQHKCDAVISAVGC